MTFRPHRLAWPVSALAMTLLDYVSDGLSWRDLESLALSEVEARGQCVRRLNNGDLGYLSEEIEI